MREKGFIVDLYMKIVEYFYWYFGQLKNYIFEKHFFLIT